MIESIDCLFHTVFDEVGGDKMEILVELIQQSRVQDKKTETKVKGKNVIDIKDVKEERLFRLIAKQIWV